MTGSAGDTGQGDLGVSLAYRDAVISGADLGSRDVDPQASLYVYAIRVWTVFRCRDLYLAAFEVPAPHQSDVEELAVHRGYPLHHRPVHRYKLHVLQSTRISQASSYNS